MNAVEINPVSSAGLVALESQVSKYLVISIFCKKDIPFCTRIT